MPDEDEQAINPVTGKPWTQDQLDKLARLAKSEPEDPPTSEDTTN